MAQASTLRAFTRNSKNRKTKKDIKLIPASRPLEFQAVGILGSLPRTLKGNQNEVILTEQYKTLTKAVSA